MKTLYIIDGHSQMYRAYYAPFRELSSPAGEPTKATYVFTAMMLKFFKQRNPTHVVMAADSKTATLHRKAVYADYKITRKPTPDDLPPQINRMMQIVSAMRIPILQLDGYEADDIMATAVAKLAGPDTNIVLISRDKDLDQLLNEHVTMFDPQDDVTIDAAWVLANKGYRPDQAVEVQTLMGDDTDNVPGVEGVGLKTAAKLIAQYGTADNVLAHADELTPKLRERLLAAREQLFVARKLVTLDRDVPIALDVEAMQFAGLAAGSAALRPLFAELGFNRLLEQLDALDAAASNAASAARGAGVSPARPEGVPLSQTPADGHDVPSWPVQRGRDARATYTCVDTLAALETLGQKLRNVKRLAVRALTTGDHPMWGRLAGVALSWQPGRAVYLPVAAPLGSPTLALDDLHRALAPVLTNPAVQKIGHDIKTTILALRTSDQRQVTSGQPSDQRQAARDKSGALPLFSGISTEDNDSERQDSPSLVAGRLSLVAGLAAPYFDTMIAAHVLDSSRLSYSLDALAADVLQHRVMPVEELLGRGKQRITLDQAPVAAVTAFACETADAALRLADTFEPQLRSDGLWPLFADLEMELLPVLTDMEIRGVAIDRAALDRIGMDFEKKAAVLRDRIVNIAHTQANAPASFNPDSPKQLADVLFTRLKLPVVYETKTGPSTDSDVLETLAADHELPGLVLEYRKLQKLIGTYCQGLAKFIFPATGRIHTSFHQTGAATGRLSSSDPNLQNIPIRTEEGRLIRSAFVAGEGHLLLSADYSQVELRVLAHLCEDPTLMAAFGQNQDIHRTVAAEVFGVSPDAVTPEMRSRAKTVNFGIIYGQTAFGLAATLRISRAEAGEFIQKYRARFPKIGEFLENCVTFARANGYVETIFGRRRRIPDIENKNPNKRALAERLAINSVVQGSAADLIKQAMVNIDARIRAEGRPSRMLLQIHDELLFEVPTDHVEAEKQMIVHEMNTAITLRVPLGVDAGVAKNWREAK